MRGNWRAGSAVPVSSRLLCDRLGAAYSRLFAEWGVAGKVADVGCGLAPCYGMYAHLDRDPVCVDWPSSQHDSPYVDVTADLNVELPLPDAGFTTVVATDVLEHLYAPSRLMAEASRVLRPGGRLLVGVPFLYWLHEEPHDHYRYTAYALRRLANDVGLRVDYLEPYGGPLDVIADLIGKLAPWLAPALRASLRTMPESLHRKRAQRFPLGYVFAASKP